MPLGRFDARGAVDQSHGGVRVGEGEEQVDRPQVRHPCLFDRGERVCVDVGEHGLCNGALTDPGQHEGADQARLDPSACGDRGLGQPVGQRQIQHPGGPARCVEKEVDVGFEIGVNAQGRPADHGMDVVPRYGRGQFGGNDASEATQRGLSGTAATHLAVQRMSQTGMHGAIDRFAGDQTSPVGLLDGLGAGDPGQ